MSSPTTLFHTFVVRYRLEESESGPTTERRGMVIHLPGNESMDFRCDGDLMGFIDRMLDPGAGEPEPGDDPSS